MCRSVPGSAGGFLLRSRALLREISGGQDELAMTPLTRRQLLARSASAAVALATSGLARRVLADSKPAATPTFAAFTESFQSWPIPEVCAKFKAIGLDGLDLTVRP